MSKQQPSSKVFKVAPGQIASSRADGKDYRGGETIDLSHCTPEEIRNLISIGLIVEAKSEATAETEVKDG
jgi:hypothetical protein